MSYTINVRVYQTNTNAFFHVVEQAVWTYGGGGSWTALNDEHVLRMGASGTCGTIRFESDTGERFIVALGVHNYARWVDIVTGLEGHDTCIKLTPEWYNGGFRAYMREKQPTEHSAVSPQGRKIEAKYTVKDGHELRIDIIIH